jgi:hypothetical protein
MTGLRYEIDVNPKDPQAMAVYARAERGDLRGSSFAFETIQDAWDWEASPPQRKLMEIKLFDVGPVTRPAYPDSTVATRALEKLAAEVQKPVETLLGAIQDGRIREELENDTVEYRLEPETTSNTGESAELRAVWSTAYVNDLPDSAFLHIEDGGTKDSEGKTTPRTLRHFPYKDASGNVDLPHLRNALARIPQSNLPQSVKDAATAKAEKLLKAEQNSLEDGELRVGKKFSAATVQAVQKIIFDLQSLVENDPDRMPTEEDDEDEEAAEDVAETIGQNTLERIAAKAEELRVLTTGSDDEEEGKKLSTATASAIVIARSRAHEALKLMSGR